MKKIKANLRRVCENMEQDRDYTIAITGKKRRGKSTLAYHVAEYVRKQLKSEIWLCYNYEDLRKAMFDSKRFDILFADETINFLSKMDWNSSDAREFVRLYDMMGYKNLFIILVMPAFKYLAKGFRTDRLDAHIWIPERGHAFLYPVEETKDGTFFPEDPAINDDFPPLPAEKEAEYRRIKEDSLERERIKETEPRSVSEFRKFVNEKLKERFPDMTQAERGELLGITQQGAARLDKQLDNNVTMKQPLPLHI